MKHALALALLLAPATAVAAPPLPPALAPSEIVAAAPSGDWTAIAASDLLVMDLAADARGKPRRVVIQLIPAPFSQGWVENIRKLAVEHWWDGTSVNRVQDNYVVQWGDASEKKALPSELAVVPQWQYETVPLPGVRAVWPISYPDAYASAMIWNGWPVSSNGRLAPVHCYGMVGVGRNLPPDTGTGAELYTVIGTPPRHLDRNIALVGRVIEGIEHLSALPRGTGALGFYETAEERVPILSVRLGNEVPGLATYEYLATESAGFARYADARANRRDAFFIRAAGGADICNIPVPVRQVRTIP